MLRLPPQPQATQDSEAFRNKLLAALQGPDPSAKLQSVETVGPQIGQDLAEQGGLAMLFTLILIFVYVMIRFRWKFAVGAIVATAHDVLLTIGFFSLLQLQFDLTVLAAVLAVLGYSLNDTVVVYDRIRDNFRLIRRGTPAEIINASVNQTLSRTIITSFVTLLSVLALLFLGGPSLEGFSIALTVGIVIGTYSSIYVASAAALTLNVVPADLAPPKRERPDDLP
jgi:preprotein translocase subunit SecF